MRPALVVRRLCACLATLHLAMVGAFLWGGLGERGTGVVGGALDTYRSAAGLGTDYSFFAPAVASAMRVGFVLETPGGRRFEPLEPDGANAEVRLRVGCVTSAVLADTATREVMSTSLAALALNRNPDATSVTVVGQRHDLPTADAWVHGERAKWTTIFTAEFGQKTASAPVATRSSP